MNQIENTLVEFPEENIPTRNVVLRGMKTITTEETVIHFFFFDFVSFLNFSDFRTFEGLRSGG